MTNIPTLFWGVLKDAYEDPGVRFGDKTVILGVLSRKSRPCYGSGLVSVYVIAKEHARACRWARKYRVHCMMHIFLFLGGIYLYYPDYNANIRTHFLISSYSYFMK